MINFNRTSECTEGLLRVSAIALVLMAAHSAVAASPAQVDNATDITATGLLIAGVIMLLLEIKIISQGILGFLGSALLVSAAVIIWRDGTPFWGVPVGWIIPAIGMIIVLTGVLGWLAVQAQKEKVATGYQGYIGEVAEACEEFSPEGRVFFNGSYWKAVSQVPVAVGDKVRIVAADRLKLVVEPLTAKVQPNLPEKIDVERV